MAVDTTLISGAYRANKPTGVPGAKFATDIADKITDPAKAYITKVGVEKKVAEAEWDKYAYDRDWETCWLISSISTTY